MHWFGFAVCLHHIIVVSLPYNTNHLEATVVAIWCYANKWNLITQQNMCAKS